MNKKNLSELAEKAKNLSAEEAKKVVGGNKDQQIYETNTNPDEDDTWEPDPAFRNGGGGGEE
jgi:hypothetical protein